MNSEENMQLSAPLSQIILKGIREIIGQEGLDQVFELSGISRVHCNGGELEETGLRYSEISALQQGFETRYGIQGAKGVELRAGRAAFCYFLKVFGDSAGINELDFRLLPSRRRMQAGLERLANVIGSESGHIISVQAQENAWSWQSVHCTECRGRQSETPVCYFTVGLLQEFLSWLSGGRVYLVEEIACRAKGDLACIIQVEKKPLD